MAVDAKQMTVDDLLELPDDGRRVELVRGELIEMPPPGKRHGRLVAHIVRLLGRRIEDERLGAVVAESGVVIDRDPATVLAPDIAVYLGALTAPIDEPEDYGDRLPDIAFEVVSPSDSADAVQDKLWIYIEAGMPMVVAVWPRRRQLSVVEAGGQWSVLTAADELDLSELIPGLRIPVADIFA